MTMQGTVLGGRYRLEEVIGRGGMAEVWKARDERLGRDVAIKRLRADLATDPTFQARFRREAQSAAGLNHPNIVAVYDTGEAPDEATGLAIPYIVMELVRGHTLRDVLRDGRKILPARALEFVQGTLDALAYSHHAGIVHRDIKPANIMLTTAGKVKVMDFGIARAVADTSATMTQTAAVIGTAQYLSPEQARGETVDNRSDIYSAGCVLYELLVGRPPFVGDSPVSVAYQHVREEPVPPSQLDPEITAPMDAITLKALAKNPDDRYQSAEEMSDDIGRLLHGQSVRAVAAGAAPTTVQPGPVPPNQTTRLAPTAALANSGPSAQSAMSADQAEEEPRRRTWPWVVGIIALILAIIAGFFIYRSLHQAPTPPQATYTEVPALKGFNEDSARSQIANNKLRVGKVNHVNQSDETKGQVVDQSPQAGASVEQNTAVDITIDDGLKRGTIPEGLVGKTQTEATKLLKDAGFKVNTQNDNAQSEPIDAKKGNVTKVSPAEGAEVQSGATVTLTIATGRSVVPNLRGLTEDGARTAAKEAGFDIQVSTRETNQATPGQVFEQEPSGEHSATADRSTPIRVVIAKAPPTPTSTPSSESPTPSGPPSNSPEPTETSNPSGSQTP